jgi:hypothetical protein
MIIGVKVSRLLSRINRGGCVLVRGVNRSLRLAAGALLLLLTVFPSGAAWAAMDLESLMNLLAQRKGGEARFTEERTVVGLDAPLKFSGRLTFSAPDRFARFTEEPRSESMEVVGNTVLLKRGWRSRQMTLDAVPEVAALADALRGTLNGDAGALRRQFQVDVSGSESRWVLTLTPMEKRLALQIQSVMIGGRGPDVESIDLRLVGGDRSLMRVEHLAATSSTQP